MSYVFFVNENFLPANFFYPKAYVEFVMNDLPDIDPWRFLWEGEMDYFCEGLAKRYPNRVLVPFARRKDNDDVACFDAKNFLEDPPVIIIHDWADPGWENRGEYKNFYTWLDQAKLESLDWKGIL